MLNYAGLGIAVTRLMTDNGACCKSFAFRNACETLGLRHIGTRPYTPRINGKAERFIETSLREWAYPRLVPPARQPRSQTLISRLGLTENNLLRPHS